MVLSRRLLSVVGATAVCAMPTGCSAPGPTLDLSANSQGDRYQFRSHAGPRTIAVGHTAALGRSTTVALSPADADSPAAGVCGAASGPLVTVVANPDTPAPRCLIVTANQRLRVVNDSNRIGPPGKPMTVRFAGFAPRAVPGEATLFDRPLGELITPGVHNIRISLYPCAGGAEVWLKP